MKCSKCDSEVETLYHQGATHLCGDCLMTFTHIHYKPVLYRVCGTLITQPFSLLNTADNARFCSIDCMAKAAGFNIEKSNKDETDKTE